MRRDAMEAPRVKTQSRWYGAWVLAGLAAVMTPAFLLAAGGGSGGRVRLGGARNRITLSRACQHNSVHEPGEWHCRLADAWQRA